MRPPLLGGPPHLRLLGGHRRIQPACDRAQQERVDRAKEIIANLNARGVRVTFEDAVAQAGAADAIGRPHIAKAAGASPASSRSSRSTCARRESVRFAQVAELEEAVGSSMTRGVAVVGHPYWDRPEQVRDLVESLVRDVSLDGIETFYPPHPPSRPALPGTLRRVRPGAHGLVRHHGTDPQDVQPLGRHRPPTASAEPRFRPSRLAGPGLISRRDPAADDSDDRAGGRRRPCAPCGGRPRLRRTRGVQRRPVRGPRRCRPLG